MPEKLQMTTANWAAFREHLARAMPRSVVRLGHDEPCRGVLSLDRAALVILPGARADCSPDNTSASRSSRNATTPVTRASPSPPVRAARAPAPDRFLTASHGRQAPRRAD